MRILLNSLRNTEKALVSLRLFASALCPFAALLAINQGVHGQTVALPVDLTQSKGDELNPAIAINPLNVSNLFVASFSDANGGGIVASVSANQGAAWTSTVIAAGKDSLPPAGADPSVAWDSFGNIYVAYLPSAGVGVAVVVSTNAGKTFMPLALLAPNDVADTPRITAGPPTNGSVWIVYKDYSLPSTPLVAQGLQPSGLGTNAAFQAIMLIPGSAAGGIPDIAVGPQGQIMVAYQNNLSSSAASDIFVSVNTNGFGTNGFGASVTAVTNAVGGHTYIPAQSTGIGITATPGVAWDDDPYSIYAGRAYLIYAATNSQNGIYIGLRDSVNNGAKWSSEVKINDDTTRNSHFFPRVAVDPETGLVATSWYDCRNDQGSASQVILETINAMFTIPNLFLTNITVTSVPAYTNWVTNTFGGTFISITVMGTNVPGLALSTNGSEVLISFGSTPEFTLTLEGSDGANTNAGSSTNVMVSIELEDFLTDAFTSGNGANKEPMLYTALSSTGGGSFLANQSIPVTDLFIAPPSTGYGSLASGSGSPILFGNYTGLAFVRGIFYPVWAENSDILTNNPDGALTNFDIYSGQVVFKTADLSVSVTNTPNPVLSDGVIVYDLTVSNAGPFSSAATLTDILPPNVTFVSAVSQGATYIVNGQTVTFTLPTLAANSALTAEIRVTASGSAFSGRWLPSAPTMAYL